MNRQIMWKDLQVDKVFKNKDNAEKVDAVIRYDRRDSRKDVIWVVEVNFLLFQKFAKVKIRLVCLNDIPLRLTL